MNGAITPEWIGFNRVDERSWRKSTRNRTIEFRELRELDELEVAERMQREVLMLSGADVVTASFLVVAPDTGGFTLGAFEDGVEKCRIQVTLATSIPESVCREINLGYRDPATINPGDFANREDEGILYVPKAGEMLYHLRERPAWAREM